MSSSITKPSPSISSWHKTLCFQRTKFPFLSKFSTSKYARVDSTLDSCSCVSFNTYSSWTSPFQNPQRWTPCNKPTRMNRISPLKRNSHKTKQKYKSKALGLWFFDANGHLGRHNQLGPTSTTFEAHSSTFQSNCIISPYKPRPIVVFGIKPDITRRATISYRC